MINQQLRMKHFIKQVIVTVCVIIPAFGMAQTDNHHEHKGLNGEHIDKFYLPYEFSADSLVGFNENAAWQQAQSQTNELWQQKRVVALLKRNYIDFHFGLKSVVPSNPTVQAPCTNPGFETGTLAGWTAVESANNNSQTMLPWTSAATTQAVIVGPGFDANLGGTVLPTVPPGGGNFAVRLGQTGTGGTSYRLNQTFTVTAANSVFVYKYAVVLQDGGHACTDQPFFNIKFETCNNVVIPCAQYQVAQMGSACSSGDPNFLTVTGSSGAGWSYLPWQTRSFDLSAYIGQCVNIEFTVGGCVATQGAHPGYCYIDAACEPMTLNLNGTDIPVGQTTTNMCSAVTNTLCAPPGFTSYTWSGPGGAAGNTNQCITTSTSGTYSVTLGMQGTSCQNPVLYSAFNIVPKPIANFTFSTNPCSNGLSVPFVDGTTLNGGPAISNWFWDFDNDGVTDNTTQSPINTYTAPGTYSAQLLVSNGGCTDSITKVLTVSQAVTANFNNTSGCLNGATNFTSTATPTLGLAAHVWNFGDGSPNGTGANPVHTYTTPGVKNVTYTVTNSSGCQSVFTKTLNVFPNPVAAISANTVCLGLPTIFNNTSSVTAPATINTWAWDFDNNGTPDNTTQSPTNTYTAAGNYSVELVVTTGDGCKDSLTIPVVVNALPTATFTPSNACVNANVALNNTSSPIANISSYSWNFGSGASPATASTANPNLIYTTAGVKTISLSITANTTCTATITKTVEAFPSPVANFSTTSVCQGTATAYTDMSTPTGSISTWQWDFTSNSSIDNATNAPTNTFPTSGTFTTSLIVISNGCSDTVSIPVNVWGHTIPNFTPDKVCYGTSSVFTNLTNETTNANVGSGTTYVWDFADASGTSTAVSPSHTYTLGGNGNATYNVTLTATSLHNCIDNAVKTVSVFAIPTASFTSNQVCLGNPTALTDASNGNGIGNTVNTFVWDFSSDGTVDVTGLPNPNYTFPNFGINNVSYTVSTSPAPSLVCSNSTNTITVFVNPNPVPDFTFVNNCINAQPNTFNGAASSIAVGTNTAYVWAYGDGAVSTPTSASTTTHTYATAGTYNTTLTVTSNKGCIANIVKQVEVYAKPSAYPANAKVCDGVAMSFTAQTLPSSGTITGWYWDFNNTITSIEANGQSPSFAFAGPGQQTVALVTETNHGCRDTVRKTIYVNYVPVALFNVNDPDGCPTLCVKFTDLTLPITGPSQINQWQWTLGDGSVVTNTNNAAVNHCYGNNSSNQLALYDVKLVVTTDSGCVSLPNNKIGYITVYPTPIANYDVNPNPGSILTPLTYFTNLSQDYTKWWWSFGDGPYKSDSVNINPTHFYNDASANTYYTNLIVMNQYGCRDTAYVAVEIKPEFTFYIPNAFSPSNDDGINDYFNGVGIGIAQYEMWIFDRWGAMIFYTDDINRGWDGRVQGKTSEGKQDVYTWKVKLKDVLGKKHDYIGHVTLLK